jgi:CheY-like chemotaxis protein
VCNAFDLIQNNYISHPLYSINTYNQGELMQSIKILVIEDDPGLLELFYTILNRLGYDVDTADTGLEGIRKFEINTYSAVITDVQMPGANGHDVLHHIQKTNKPQTPIIGISGTPWLLDNRGFDAVIAKPFSIGDLNKKLDDLVGAQFKPMVSNSDCN